MSFTHKYLGSQGPQLPADGVFLRENLVHETAMLLFSKESGVRTSCLFFSVVYLRELNPEANDHLTVKTHSFHSESPQSLLV